MYGYSLNRMPCGRQTLSRIRAERKDARLDFIVVRRGNERLTKGNIRRNIATRFLLRYRRVRLGVIYE